MSLAPPPGPVYVLYHGEHCADGFGAAYAVWVAWGNTQVTYIPVSYHEPPPVLPEGAAVFVLDFSYRRGVMEALHARHPQLLVLDHHASAAVELAGLPYCTVTPGRAGAVLAWEHWHPHTLIPPLLAYVQDRDLWTWGLPKSREISLALRHQPWSFPHWRTLSLTKLAELGTALQAMQTSQIDQLCAWAAPGQVLGVPAAMLVNSPLEVSELCDELLFRYPDRRLIAAYWEDYASGRRHWSLRSRDPVRSDLLATAVGGGGHPRAAGFAVRLQAATTAAADVAFIPEVPYDD